EPALGTSAFPACSRGWTSGGELAADTDLLIHDSQYAAHEYDWHVGWGHSSLHHSLAFGALAGTHHLVPFHHDPGHSDDDLDRLIGESIAAVRPPYMVTPGREGMVFDL